MKNEFSKKIWKIREVKFLERKPLGKKKVGPVMSYQSNLEKNLELKSFCSGEQNFFTILFQKKLKISLQKEFSAKYEHLNQIRKKFFFSKKQQIEIKRFKRLFF